MIGCWLQLKNRVQSWVRDYDSLQYLALVLIYIQIGSALIGSLGALYNGVLLINLGIALFALVAIENSSQSLGRTYAVLLFSSLLLDVLWLFSSFLWIQIYRLGLSSVENSAPRDADYGFSFLSPSSPALARQCSDSAVILGGSIYNPTYYSSLFEDGRDTRTLNQNQNPGIGDNGSTSGSDAPQLKVSTDRSFETIDEDNIGDKLQNV